MKYLNKLLTLTVLFLLMACSNKSTISNVVSLDKGWKFKTGDDITRAKPDFDDSKWDSIAIGKYWEVQGHENYDGYAWYRIKLVIPSSLKESSYLKDSLQILLGKVDDCDQLYINGRFIGQNNKLDNAPPTDSIFVRESGFYATDRRYAIAVNNPCILWDKENVIAVRVFDQGGGGGMYSGIPVISMVDISENLIIDKVADFYRFDKEKVSKTFIVKNNSKIELKGKFIVDVQVDETRESLFKSESGIDLKPGEMTKLPVSFTVKPEPTTTSLTFRHSDSKMVMTATDEVPYILTPQHGDAPKINGAKVIGVRPGKPFLFTIPVTGLRPLIYNVTGLPKGLEVDVKTGIISGKVMGKGEYKVILNVKNNVGKDNRELKIVVGDKIALTPPLGWNSWNCWGLSIDEAKVIQSAHQYIDKGLVNHGWTFINIDDGWEAKRDAKGEIIPNEKFSSMKALSDTLHKMGLKFGIYSSPGPLTCGGYTGSYRHERQDAKTYAKWGVDYLKYDWCSYGNIAKDNSLNELKKPYLVMEKALAETDRDIVFSLCQYGMGNVWEWGADVGGNLWRTTGDITDEWESLNTIGFNQVKNNKFAGPGHWNDPDMMIVGWVGWGTNLHPSRLTVNEQYTHVSLWALLSAPMLIGCDLNRLDDFTLNLLTNDEVLALDQDPLGKQALPLVIKGDIQVWVKDLEDGGKAAGIFNLNNKSQEISINMAEIGLKGMQSIRDIWRQKNIGESDNKFSATIPAHGVVLIKLTEKK